MAKAAAAKVARDIQREVTDAILAQMEAGKRPWVQPWNGGSMVPVNAVTRKPYRGANVLALWARQLTGGFAESRWLTFNQAVEATGAGVRKGEKGVQIVKWLKVTFKPKDGEAVADGEERSGMIARAYTVFNVAQLQNPLPGVATALPLDESARLALAESMIAAIPHKAQPNGPAAFYTPRTDTVTMPAFAAFHEPLDFYSTYAHELAHWTGADTRLNRLPVRVRRGSEDYAFEELVAELSAAFVLARLGLTLAPRADHAAYLAHWLESLKDDKKYIFEAAGKAQKAVDFLFETAAAGGFVEPAEDGAEAADEAEESEEEMPIAA